MAYINIHTQKFLNIAEPVAGLIDCDDIQSDAFNAGLRDIQDQLGITCGDIAGVFFSEADTWNIKSGRNLIISNYINREIRFDNNVAKHVLDKVKNISEEVGESQSSLIAIITIHRAVFRERAELALENLSHASALMHDILHQRMTNPDSLEEMRASQMLINLNTTEVEGYPVEGFSFSEDCAGERTAFFYELKGLDWCIEIKKDGLFSLTLDRTTTESHDLSALEHLLFNYISENA